MGRVRGGWIAALLALSSCSGLPSDSAAEQMLFESAAGETYKAMKKADPDRFQRLLVRINQGKARGETPAQLENAVMRFMIEAEGKLKPQIRQASHATIAKYRQAQVASIEALQAADPKLCAHYIAEGGVVMPYKHAQVDAAVAHHRALGWEAAAEGRDRPAGRTIGPPSKADWAAIDKAMVAGGLSPALVRQFFDPATARGLSAETQCSTGLAFHKAIEALPADRANSFYFALMDSA